MQHKNNTKPLKLGQLLGIVGFLAGKRAPLPDSEAVAANRPLLSSTDPADKGGAAGNGLQIGARGPGDV